MIAILAYYYVDGDIKTWYQNYNTKNCHTYNTPCWLIYAIKTMSFESWLLFLWHVYFLYLLVYHNILIFWNKKSYAHPKKLYYLCITKKATRTKKNWNYLFSNSEQHCEQKFYTVFAIRNSSEVQIDMRQHQTLSLVRVGVPIGESQHGTNRPRENWQWKIGSDVLKLFS